MVVAPACRVLFVSAVEEAAASSARLLHRDKFHPDAATLAEWWATGEKGGVMAWPVELLFTSAQWEAAQAAQADVAAKSKRQRDGGGGQPAAKRRPIMDALVKQCFNPEEMRAVVAHPRFSEVMTKAGLELGTCGETLARAAHLALPFVADVGALLQPVQSQRAVDEEGQVPARKFNHLGELKCAPKIANTEERIGLVNEYEQQLRAHAGHKAARTALHKKVNGILHQANCIDAAAITANKKPTIAQMKGFIEMYAQAAVPAWRQYLIKHGVGFGGTIAWKYYFDFLHGGHVYHQSLKQAEPLPLVLDEERGQADASTTATPLEAEEEPQPPAGAAEHPAIPT
jgi:hypothetical protein